MIRTLCAGVCVLVCGCGVCDVGGTGGTAGSGGAVLTGGTVGAGGSSATGGHTSSGGLTGSGGATSSGGTGSVDTWLCPRYATSCYNRELEPGVTVGDRWQPAVTDYCRKVAVVDCDPFGGGASPRGRFDACCVNTQLRTCDCPGAGLSWIACQALTSHVCVGSILISAPSCGPQPASCQ